MAKKNLRTLMNEEIKKQGVQNIASYALLTDKGVRFQINDVCYARARLNTCNYKDAKEIKESVISLKNAEYLRVFNKRSFNRWVDFILNRSFFADNFKTKRVCTAKRYGVEMDVDKPHSCVVASMIAMREGWEFPALLDSWNFLVKKGIDERVAYLFARMFIKNKNKFVATYFGGHQTINSTITLRQAKDLFENGMVKERVSHRWGTSYKIYATMRCESQIAQVVLSQDFFNKGLVEERGWGRENKYHTTKSLISTIKAYEKGLLS